MWSYGVFYIVLFTIRIFEFCAWIRKTVLQDARAYLKSRDEPKMTVKELEEELEQCNIKLHIDSSYSARADLLKERLNENLGYLERSRGYGQGEVRIGKSMEFSEDIYSLCFVACVSNEIMDLYFDAVEGKHIDRDESSDGEEPEDLGKDTTNTPDEE